jgi:hypothetical protein
MFNYLYAFKMQILVGIFGSLFFYSVFYVLESNFVLFIWAFGILLLILDFKSRLKEFIMIRKKVDSNPSKKDRFIRAQAFAPCRRNATAVAVRDISYANKIYYEMGYRWYHLIPDGFFGKALTLKYWKAALFK